MFFPSSKYNFIQHKTMEKKTRDGNFFKNGKNSFLYNGTAWEKSEA